MAPAAPYPAPSAALLARIDTREAGLGTDVAIQAKLDRLNVEHRALREDEARLWRAAGSAASSRQRVLWLRRALEPVLNAVAGDSACRPGCAHCCHIPVLITEREARVIARETGQALQQPGPGRSLQPQWSGDAVGAIDSEEFVRESERVAAFQREELGHHHGEACPFLARDSAGGTGAGRCTIYGSRPLVCRQLVNLDQDELLCHLVPGREVRVPYLDVRQHAAVQMAVLGIGQRLADIRSWFRASGRTEGTAVVGQDRHSSEASP